MTIDISTDASVSVRCAAWTAAADVSPIGTATSCAVMVLVEWPLPWPRDVSEIDALAPLHAALRAVGGRLQCLAPAGPHAADDGLREVAIYRAAPTPDGSVGPYREQSRRVPAADVVGAALKLLANPAIDIANQPRPRVLVCAHGRRDRCCGSHGTTLATEVAADLGSDAAVWRTSHLGGHRFAPTALVLPDATQWALLDRCTLRRIVRRESSPTDVIQHYRGFAGYGHGAASVVDRYVLATRGWEWLEQPRRAQRTADGWWRVDAADGTAWEGSVSVRRSVPVPACGEPIDKAKKSEDEYTLDWAHPCPVPTKGDARCD